MNSSNNTVKLDTKEENFCLLLTGGVAPYAGNIAKCYEAAFGVKDKYSLHHGQQLMKRPDIKGRLAELEEDSAVRATDMKKYLTSTYMKIIDECSSAEYSDRRGNPLSPAAMRSVAINAGKALAELYPIKEAQVSKVNIGAGEGDNAPAITFNVIVPDKSSVTPGQSEDLEAK